MLNNNLILKIDILFFILSMLFALVIIFFIAAYSSNKCEKKSINTSQYRDCVNL